MFLICKYGEKICKILLKKIIFENYAKKVPLLLCLFVNYTLKY